MSAFASGRELPVPNKPIVFDGNGIWFRCSCGKKFDSEHDYEMHRSWLLVEYIRTRGEVGLETVAWIIQGHKLAGIGS